MCLCWVVARQAARTSDDPLAQLIDGAELEHALRWGGAGGSGGASCEPDRLSSATASLGGKRGAARPSQYTHLHQAAAKGVGGQRLDLVHDGLHGAAGSDRGMRHDGMPATARAQ